MSQNDGRKAVLLKERSMVQRQQSVCDSESDAAGSKANSRLVVGSNKTQKNECRLTV